MPVITIQPDALKTAQAADMMSRGLLAIGNVMPPILDKAVEDAKSRARVKTGAMRDSIDYEAIDDYTYSLFGDVDYFIYHELGTSKISPQPMITPAAIIAQADMNTAISNFINSVINSPENIPPKVTKTHIAQTKPSVGSFKRPTSGGAEKHTTRAHKYISRIKIGGKWHYTYADSGHG